MSNLSASVGDATNLEEIADRSFDIVLVFGPMYHLPPKEREMAMMESRRICKDGGIILYAYINKLGAYLHACLDETMKSRYPNKHANHCVLTEERDDILPDVFFYTMPEEMERAAMERGLTVLQNTGVDFVFSSNNVNAMTDEQYEDWTVVMDYMAGSRSCTGTSSHAILVCRNTI